MRVVDAGQKLAAVRCGRWESARLLHFAAARGVRGRSRGGVLL